MCRTSGRSSESTPSCTCSPGSRQKVPARLLLVGDGPELGTVYRLGRELGISHLVNALGAQEGVIPLLSTADVFLLPSAQESFGLAALEAMACEVPVVASNVGGLPEVIEHGRTGFLHDPTDLDGMAASAISVLEDPDAARGRSRRMRCDTSPINSASIESCRCTERCYADVRR